MALCDKCGRERSRLIGEPLGDLRTRFKLCGHQGGHFGPMSLHDSLRPVQSGPIVRGG